MVFGDKDLDVPPNKLRRLSSVVTAEHYTEPPKPKKNPVKAWWEWYTSWAIPGLGMFSEAYIIFSLGLTKPLQNALFPTCFKTHTECDKEITHVQNYIQICGIIVGMLVFGALGDIIGRRWGSRIVATIMLSGTILLTFSPLVSKPATFLNFYIFAATWYGFGVGGEYPMASASAAERSQASAELRNRRGEQVVLTFSGQGMGNLVNGCVILICMAMFGLTGAKLDPIGSRNVLMIQFAVGAAVSVFMVVWRYFKLKESKVWEVEKEDFREVAEEGIEEVEAELIRASQTTAQTSAITAAEQGQHAPAAPAHRTHGSSVSTVQRIMSGAGGAGGHDPAHPHPHITTPERFMRRNALVHFWPRLVATCMAWVANDFAFYGNKLFQSTFIALLYPQATEFERMQWTVLNSAISLMGYWCAAALVDKPWFGRRRMQNYGFLMMFVLFLICGAAYDKLVASVNGLRAFQALYFLSSFFNQFGPNCTTWLVAAEVYPTDVRTTFQGISAAAGKVGAIIADVVFGYVTQRMTFYLSAAFGLVGAAVTWLFLPDTTGMSLDELDRMAKYMLTREFEHYHGEAVNPKHLSTYEMWVLKWHKHYDPVQDQQHAQVQMQGTKKWNEALEMAGIQGPIWSDDPPASATAQQGAPASGTNGTQPAARSG